MKKIQSLMLESETRQETDYRRIKRNKAILLIRDNMANGWMDNKSKPPRQCCIIREQQMVLEKYLDYQLSAGTRSALTIYDTYRVLLHFSDSIRKPYSTVTKDDICKYIANIRLKTRSDSYISGQLCKIRLFFMWFYDGDRTVERDINSGIPTVVSWIQTPMKHKELQKSSLLTLEDIWAMVNVATNDRDKFLPLGLYESGCRAEEFQNIKLKNISLEGSRDKELMFIDVEGKTGRRRVICKLAIPYFKRLLENHPYRNNPEAALLLNSYKKPTQISLSTMADTLKKLAFNANISKRVYPHIFRHSRATFLAGSGWGDSELRHYFGWTKDSNMSSVYVHLSSENITNKMKQLYGIPVQQEQQIKDTLFKPKICNCGQENPPTQMFCVKCNNKLLNQEQQKKESAESVLNRLVNNPELSIAFSKLLEQAANLK